MSDTAMDSNSVNYVLTIRTGTSTLEHQGQRQQQTTRAEQRAQKRAKKKATRARLREEKGAYVQEVLQEQRLENMLSSMGSLGIAEEDASQGAEDDAEIRPHAEQTTSYEGTDDQLIMAEAKHSFAEQKEAEKRAEHRLIIQAGRDFRIKKRDEAQGATRQLTRREYRKASKQQEKKKREREHQQTRLEPLSPDAQVQGEMIPSSGYGSWREARRQARLIVSQGAQYVPTSPHQDTPLPSRPRKAQGAPLYVPRAPELHREPAFRHDYMTLPDTPTLSHASRGSDGQAQIEVGSRYDQGGPAMPPRRQIQEQVGSPMEVND